MMGNAVVGDTVMGGTGLDDAAVGDSCPDPAGLAIPSSGCSRGH